MTLKVLVTGGTGFVGKHLIRLLAEHDVELHLVVRENPRLVFRESELVGGCLPRA
jgi:uncharacterized protein YbjT (DUF2867 family)